MNEAELKEWAQERGCAYIDRAEEDGSAIIGVDMADLEQLFSGKKLVDAGAVVLSVEDAQYIARATALAVIESDAQLAALRAFDQAINLSRGK